MEQLSSISSTEVDRDGGAISRWWDFAAGFPNIVFCIFGGSGFVIQITRDWAKLWDLVHILGAISQLSGAAFLFLQAILVCIRRPPKYRAPGVCPRALALVAANFTLFVVLLPRASLPPETAFLSTLLLLIGTAGSTWCLIHLGKSFAIYPQARCFVQTGPYRAVRHPLYVCEQLSCLGLVMHYPVIWAAPILIGGMALQFPRMKLEENALEREFPAYRSYRARVPMFLPKLAFAIPSTADNPNPPIALYAVLLTLILIAILSWANVTSGEFGLFSR